jgi:hypothetical protein
MWTTHDRRGFYLPEETRDLIEITVVDNNPIPQQFTDLSGQALSAAGWVHCHGSTAGKNPVSDHYYSYIHSLELGLHTTLENMLLLDLLVRQTGIFCCSMMIMDSVYDLIVQHSQHDLCEHLHSAIDWTKVDLQGEYDYLRSQPSPDQYFRSDGWHPNRQGHSLWFQQRLVPRLTGK